MEEGALDALIALIDFSPVIAAVLAVAGAFAVLYIAIMSINFVMINLKARKAT